MAIEIKEINELPAAAVLTGVELFELEQASVSVKESLSVITTYIFDYMIDFLDDYFTFGSDELTILTDLIVNGNVDIDGNLNVDGSTTGIFLSLLHIRDEKAQNTPGGTFTQGAWRTRDLTAEKTNEIAGAGLAANQITLPEGTYYAEWSAPAFQINAHQTKLYNITDTSDIIIGTSEYVDSASGAGSRSFGSGRFTLTAQKVLELQHYCTNTRADDGLGNECNLTTEVYSDIRIWQIL